MTSKDQGQEPNPSPDASTWRLIRALEEIQAETLLREERRRHDSALRRLETSTFDELLAHAHHVRVGGILGHISGFGNDALTIQSDDGQIHLLQIPLITSVEFLQTSTNPVPTLVTFAAEFERLINQGPCVVLECSGRTFMIDTLVALAEDYLYYRSHIGVPTALRLSSIVRVSPRLL